MGTYEAGSVSAAEQETCINYFPRQVTDRMSVYSCIPGEVRYYLKLASDYPEDVRILTQDKYGIGVEMPSAWYRRPKPPNKRNLTEEQKAAAAARLTAARARKGSGGDEQGDPG